MTEKKNEMNESLVYVKSKCEMKNCEQKTGKENEILNLWALWSSHFAA